MADRLEVSKGSVSTNIRVLERWKVARRVYNRKDRKNYYEIRGNIWEIETEITRTVVTDLLDKFSDLIKKCQADLKAVKPKDGEEKKEIAFLKERFDEALEYLEAVDYLMGVILRDGNITPATIKKIEIK
jgi:DNA-binding transcriptional regulator GbsR (MarR family)